MSLYGSPEHFGERPCRGVKGELLEEGETPSILAGDPEEDPMLLRLPSSRSDERLRREKVSNTTPSWTRFFNKIDISNVLWFPQRPNRRIWETLTMS